MSQTFVRATRGACGTGGMPISYEVSRTQNTILIIHNTRFAVNNPRCWTRHETKMDCNSLVTHPTVGAAVVGLDNSVPVRLS